MAKNDLQKVLSELELEGKISDEQSAEILWRLESGDHDPRKSVLAEIGGYLGGAFVVVAATVFIGQRFDDLSRITRSGIFISLSVVLALISILVGSQSPVKARLTSVLAMGAAICLTGSIATYFETNKAPAKSFIAGALVATFFFIRNRTEILHIGTYGYLFVSSLMLSATVTSRPEDGPAFELAAFFWLALASIWIYLAHRRTVHTTLAYFFACGTFFISIQVLFAQDDRVVSYFLAIVIALSLVQLFILERAWPLLAAAVLIVTVSVGEFVAETLGGSAGALAGLFAAGVALIASSLFAIRSIHRT